MSIDSRIPLAALAAISLFCLWQRAEISKLKTELAGIETAFAKAQVRAVQANLAATAEALQAREEYYATSRDAGRAARKLIVAAGPEPGRAHPDDLLPGALSDALLLQSAGVCAGRGGDSPAGASIRPEAAAGTAGGGGISGAGSTGGISGTGSTAGISGIGNTTGTGGTTGTRGIGSTGGISGIGSTGGTTATGNDRAPACRVDEPAS